MTTATIIPLFGTGARIAPPNPDNRNTKTTARPDPIFAVLDRYKSAAMGDDLPKENAAYDTLLSTVPTTYAGAAAFVSYAFQETMSDSPESVIGLDFSGRGSGEYVGFFLKTLETFFKRMGDLR